MGIELQQGNLYVCSKDGSWNKLCAIKDMHEIVDDLSDDLPEPAKPDCEMIASGVIICESHGYSCIYHAETWVSTDGSVTIRLHGIPCIIAYNLYFPDKHPTSIGELDNELSKLTSGSIRVKHCSGNRDYIHKSYGTYYWNYIYESKEKETTEMVLKEIWDKLELIAGNLYILEDNGDWNKICAITDIDVTESCSMLDRAKKVVKEHIESAMCGIFDTRNCAGDEMVTIYDEDGLTVDICYGWEYFEVFGLSMSEFQLLEDFYETLCKEVRTKEKEKEMNDYIVMAEHGVSCIITHQKQEETKIYVKIIKNNGSGRYEVIYINYGYEPFSHSKFYCGIPCLGEVRDDIQHFYGAGCINVNDIRVLLDEACGVSRRVNMAKQLMNSRYGLASADIRDCFGDSTFDKIYNNLNISREMQFAYTGKWPGIECKTTAKDQYRNREKLPEIKEVIFNRPATIVKWADGTKTVVKVQGREKYDKEKGLAMAIAKKAMGNSSYYATIMNKYLEDKK